MRLWLIVGHVLREQLLGLHLGSVHCQLPCSLSVNHLRILCITCIYSFFLERR
jgi:hypothetical protein